MKPAYPVETDRLLLRPFAVTDFEALLAIQSRADVARYLYWDPRTAAEVRETLDAKVRATAIVAEGDSLSLAAVLLEGDELIGDCSLFRASAEHRQGEIGFSAVPAARATSRTRSTRSRSPRRPCVNLGSIIHGPVSSARGS